MPKPKVPNHLTNGSQSLGLRFKRSLEFWINTRLIRYGVGPVMKRFFRLPIYVYRMGLGDPFNRILLLSTTGRKTGRTHVVALEYGYNAETDTYDVMAAWGGKNDWYRNARANPEIRVWVGKRKFIGRAEPASAEYVIATMQLLAKGNPRAKEMWHLLSGVPLDGTDENWRANAAFFPMLLLKPEQEISDFPLK